MTFPTLGEIILAAQNQDNLGISDRETIIDYVTRSLDLALYKAHWNYLLGDMDICSDCHGNVTLPPEVDVVLAVNVGGSPTYFRNSWFQYHINGPGSTMINNSGPLGTAGLFTWDEKMYYPILQDIKDWSYIVALVEDPIDGDGSLSMQVFGETMDSQYNVKEVLTIPTVGASNPGVSIPLLNGYASMDNGMTLFRKITRVVKPITRGYVKLMAFPPEQGANGVTLGYYGPNETQPAYRRLHVAGNCQWVRIKYRRKEVKLVNDSDIVPIPSKQAMIYLMKACRMFDTYNPQAGEFYQSKAVEMLSDIQQITDGVNSFHLQVDPSYGISTIDYR